MRHEKTPEMEDRMWSTVTFLSLLQPLASKLP